MKALFYAVILLAMLPIAQAAVTLVSPDADYVTSSSSTSFVFTSSEEANCTLSVGSANYAANAGANTPVTITKTFNEGAYSWAVYCTANGSQSSSETRLMIVDLTAPDVKLSTPNSLFSTGAVELSYLPEDLTLKNCSLLLNISGFLSPVKANLSPQSSKNNVFKIDLPDNSFLWNVLCWDNAGHTGQALFSRVITVDTTPPSATVTSPVSMLTSPNALLEVKTSEKAECRYAAAANYSSMDLFGITGDIVHQQMLAGLGEGSYTYYVICQDYTGNKMAAQAVRIDIHLPPTARITLGDQIAKAGIANVTLTTSKPLSSVPTLSYNAGLGEIPVSLAGSGTAWSGNILVTQDIGQRVAVFYFKGVDQYGYAGTSITAGQSFIIDTIPPGVPSDLKVQANNYSIRIDWYLGENDIDHFNVYRAKATPVSYLDLYASSGAQSFADTAVDEKVTYYYRIAAVDKAGNIGLMSSEIYATAESKESSNKTSQPEVKPLQPQLMVEANDALKTVQSIELSIEMSQQTLGALTGDAKEIASQLVLVESAASALSRIGELKAQLESLKNQYADEAEFHKVVSSIRDEATTLEHSTVKEVKIIEHYENINIVSKDQILKALLKTTESIEIKEKQRAQFAETDERELQDLQITTKLNSVKLVYADGIFQEISVITHSFIYLGTEPAQDSIIVVFMPKSVANSSTQLNYFDNPPEVLEDDPVLKWGFLSMGPEAQQISYSLNKKLGSDDINQLEVVPLLNINKIATAETPTGFAIADVAGGMNFWFLLTGVLVVAALAGYYFMTSPRDRSQRKESVPDPLSSEMLTTLDAKLSTMQFEIDEKIYPLIISIKNSTKTGQDLSSEETIRSLVEIANHYLTIGQPAKAQLLYSSIQLLYQSLTKEQKAMLGSICIDLHMRLKKNQ
ncbi:MAG: hypothetical protein V1702_04735 [Candidatus Woesearchaeota archaeon]